MDVCVVIGAGPLLGTAVARRFGNEGMRVALVARGADRLASQCSALGVEGIDAHYRVADAADPEGLSNVVGALADELGHVGVLVVNVASQGLPGRVSDVALDTMRRALAVNLVGPLAAIQRVLPAMREEGRGTILATGGSFGIEPSPDYVPIGVGKAALRNLTFSLAKEAEPWGVHAAMVMISGVIAPGTEYDPDRLADLYWELHEERPPWRREVQV